MIHFSRRHKLTTTALPIGALIMKFAEKLALALSLVVLTATGLSACSPKVGSKEWCEDMKKKDKGLWTANDATEFAKSCIL
jgi:hypothetical protein